MISWKNYFIYQIDYQYWANETLFDSLDKLSDDARKAPEQLLFKSIHGTLNRLLAANQLWLARLQQSGQKVDLERIQFEDYRELKQALRQTVRATQRHLEAQAVEWFTDELSYQSTSGREYQNWVHDVLTHVCNDYAHYRGQIAAVAIRLGAPAPLFDYITYRRDMQLSLQHARQTDGQS